MNPWHEVPLGDDAPRVVNAIVEIPSGTKLKYELDLKLGVLKLDRILRSAVAYPFNYGMLPRTLETDGDPLDALILCQEPLVPLCVVAVRPIGALMTSSSAGSEPKVLAVADKDPRFSSCRSIKDLPGGLFDEIEQFFEDYKRLEKSPTRVLRVLDAGAARARIRRAASAYARKARSS